MRKALKIAFILTVVAPVIWYGYQVVMAKLAWREFNKTKEKIQKLRDADPLNFN